ncbi:MAG: CoA ester lyase [Oscillospiraceae bacterium]|jgi:citrate lyase subunit beta/citryl-CoA lyase|nr:CoA ester lyase [Oscillospiraceae bacterium]
MRRSMLFLPGNTPNMLVNGAFLGADAVILDLEDAVAPSEKDAARVLVRNTIRYMDFRGCEVIVRINAVDSDFWQADLDEILPQKPDLILLPKSSSAQDVLAADAYIGQKEAALGFAPNTVRLMPLIETALGVENAFSIASACPRVAALFLGAEDLTADLRCQRTKAGREIEYARTRLVVAARAANVDVYDTPFTDVNDDEGIQTDAAYAKALGFTGKASISPRHVEVINRVFSPTQKEIDYAYEVMDAIRLAKEQGRGAIALRGKMIDAPIVARAEQTIAAAREMGLGREDRA